MLRTLEGVSQAIISSWFNNMRACAYETSEECCEHSCDVETDGVFVEVISCVAISESEAALHRSGDRHPNMCFTRDACSGEHVAQPAACACVTKEETCCGPSRLCLCDNEGSTTPWNEVPPRPNSRWGRNFHMLRNQWSLVSMTHAVKSQTRHDCQPPLTSICNCHRNASNKCEIADGRAMRCKSDATLRMCSCHSETCTDTCENSHQYEQSHCKVTCCCSDTAVVPLPVLSGPRCCSCRLTEDCMQCNAYVPCQERCCCNCKRRLRENRVINVQLVYKGHGADQSLQGDSISNTATFRQHTPRHMKPLSSAGPSYRSEQLESGELTYISRSLASAGPSYRSEPSASAGPSYRSEPSAFVEPSYRNEPSAFAEPTYRSEPSATAEPSYRSEPSPSAGPNYRSEPSASAGPSYRSKPSVSAGDSHRRELSAPARHSYRSEPSVSAAPSNRSDHQSSLNGIKHQGTKANSLAGSFSYHAPTKGDDSYNGQDITSGIFSADGGYTNTTGVSNRRSTMDKGKSSVKESVGYSVRESDSSITKTTSDSHETSSSEGTISVDSITSATESSGPDDKTSSGSFDSSTSNLTIIDEEASSSDDASDNGSQAEKSDSSAPSGPSGRSVGESGSGSIAVPDDADKENRVSQNTEEQGTQNGGQHSDDYTESKSEISSESSKDEETGHVDKDSSSSKVSDEDEIFTSLADVPASIARVGDAASRTIAVSQNSRQSHLSDQDTIQSVDSRQQSHISDQVTEHVESSASTSSEGSLGGETVQGQPSISPEAVPVSGMSVKSGSNEIRASEKRFRTATQNAVSKKSTRTASHITDINAGTAELSFPTTEAGNKVIVSKKSNNKRPTPDYITDKTDNMSSTYTGKSTVFQNTFVQSSKETDTSSTSVESTRKSINTSVEREMDNTEKFSDRGRSTTGSTAERPFENHMTSERNIDSGLTALENTSFITRSGTLTEEDATTNGQVSSEGSGLKKNEAEELEEEEEEEGEEEEEEYETNEEEGEENEEEEGEENEGEEGEEQHMSANGPSASTVMHSLIGAPESFQFSGAERSREESVSGKDLGSSASENSMSSGSKYNSIHYSRKPSTQYSKEHSMKLDSKDSMTELDTKHYSTESDSEEHFSGSTSSENSANTTFEDHSIERHSKKYPSTILSSQHVTISSPDEQTVPLDLSTSASNHSNESNHSSRSTASDNSVKISGRYSSKSSVSTISGDDLVRSVSSDHSVKSHSSVHSSVMDPTSDRSIHSELSEHSMSSESSDHSEVGSVSSEGSVESQPSSQGALKNYSEAVSGSSFSRPNLRGSSTTAEHSVGTPVSDDIHSHEVSEEDIVSTGRRVASHRDLDSHGDVNEEHSVYTVRTRRSIDRSEEYSPHTYITDTGVTEEHIVPGRGRVTEVQSYSNGRSSTLRTISVGVTSEEDKSTVVFVGGRACMFCLIIFTLLLFLVCLVYFKYFSCYQWLQPRCSQKHYCFFFKRPQVASKWCTKCYSV